MHILGLRDFIWLLIRLGIGLQLRIEQLPLLPHLLGSLIGDLLLHLVAEVGRLHALDWHKLLLILAVLLQVRCECDGVLLVGLKVHWHLIGYLDWLVHLVLVVFCYYLNRLLVI